MPADPGEVTPPGRRATDEPVVVFAEPVTVASASMPPRWFSICVYTSRPARHRRHWRRAVVAAVSRPGRISHVCRTAKARSSPRDRAPPATRARRRATSLVRVAIARVRLGRVGGEPQRAFPAGRRGAEISASLPPARVQGVWRRSRPGFICLKGRCISNWPATASCTRAARNRGVAMSVSKRAMSTSQRSMGGWPSTIHCSMTAPPRRTTRCRSN